MGLITRNPPFSAPLTPSRFEPFVCVPPLPKWERGIEEPSRPRWNAPSPVLGEGERERRALRGRG